MRIAVWFAIFLAGTSATIAQQAEPRLVVEYDHSSCDDSSAYTDLLAFPMSERLAKALAVFYPKKGAPAAALQYEDYLRFSIKVVKRFGDRPPKIIHGKPREKTMVQYWLIPEGATEPGITAAAAGEIFEGVTEPFLYNTEFGGEECPGADPELMADLLTFNPNVKLHVIVRGRSKQKRYRKIAKWRRVLYVEHSVPKDRIYFSYTRHEIEYRDVEFWLVPTGN